MHQTKTLPGLIDLQVNGYAGVDFNRLPLSVKDVKKVCRLLREEGVVGFLPTLITNAPDLTPTLAKIILNTTELYEPGIEARILGLHLEGPFISPHPGARGAHPERWITKPDFDWVRRMQDIAEGKIQLMTLSPEWDGSAQFIESVVGLGIRVAIGHTMATLAQITEAVDAGATLSTHFGNGIPALVARHPNPIWSQMAEPRLWASVIGDGFHIPREVFEVVRVMKKDKVILISDSTEFTGREPGQYDSPIGGHVVLTPENRLHLAEDENLLAGSAMSLRQIVNRLAKQNWATFDDAWIMASERPWRYLVETGKPNNAPNRKPDREPDREPEYVEVVIDF